MARNSVPCIASSQPQVEHVASHLKAGGGFGWLVVIGALVIPGIGPLIAAGPVMAALAGAAVTATAASITGAFVGLGIPDYEATPDVT